jgi:hypothetical protein
LKFRGLGRSFMSAVPSRDDKMAPLSEASDSEINRLVDDVLRSGKHLTLPADGEAQPVLRYHARAIAEQMHRLAKQLAGEGPSVEGQDDRDEWWFEISGKRLGPISLKKIRFLWEDGELTPDSLCWHEGFPKWVSLFKVSELAEALIPKLHVNVDEAARAFARSSSGEWASPAASGMEAANRKKLESSQKLEPVVHKPIEPMPLSTPLNLADERAQTFTALRSVPIDDNDDEVTVSRRGGGSGNAVLSGVIAGLIAAAAIVGVRVLWPAPVLPPIIITMGAPGSTPVAAVAPAPVAPPPRPVEPAPLAAAAAPVAVPAPVAAAPTQPAPAGKPAPAAAPKPPPEPEKPATVEQAFAKAFAEAPPDELTMGEVFEVVKGHKPQWDACVDAQHTATPDATGKLVVRWTVEPDGHVSDVAAQGEMSKSALAECLSKQIAGWTFPKHALEHPPVEFPFKY